MCMVKECWANAAMDYSTAVKQFIRLFRAYFIRGWPAPVHSFISRFQMATLQSINVGTCCSDNGLDDAENPRNETAPTRFTFTQIHQYLQFGTYPSDFQKSDKDPSTLRALMAISTMSAKVSGKPY